MGNARDTITKEFITYVFGVLYAVTLIHIQSPDSYRTFKLGVLGRVALAARHTSRVAIRIGDGALDAYKREIEHV